MSFPASALPPGPKPNHIRQRFYQSLPQGAVVLDVGCLGFRELAHAQAMAREDIRHAGVDYAPPVEGGIPAGFDFRAADLDHAPLPFADDSFDGVVASHVIEHMRDPIALVRECIRVCRPGGLVYIEAPSERALLLPGMPFQHELFYSLSYYDDPTHQGRPWTPQAFYRLSCYLGCEPLAVGHLRSWKQRLLLVFTLPWALLTRRADLLESILWRAVGWSAYLLLRKPEALRGAPEFRYHYPAQRLTGR